MTKTIVKIQLPETLSHCKIDFFANTVKLTDLDGNVFHIPDTLIDRLYGYLSNKREEEIQLHYKVNGLPKRRVD